MSTLSVRIDQTLTTRGWHYDSGEEQFFAGDRPLELEELVDVLPDLTLVELGAYQDAKYDELQRRATQ